MLTSNFDVLQRDYYQLQMQNGTLRQQYKNLRRPFSVSKGIPYTDALQFEPVASYPDKHPYEKPAAMLEHIINASSRLSGYRPGFFMGSVFTVKAAIKLVRHASSIEFEEARFEQTKARLTQFIFLSY